MRLGSRAIAWHAGAKALPLDRQETLCIDQRLAMGDGAAMHDALIDARNEIDDLTDLMAALIGRDNERMPAARTQPEMVCIPGPHGRGPGC